MSYKNFLLTNEIDRYIQDNDRDGVVTVLVSLCSGDKNFSKGEFDNAMEYVTQVKQYADLMEPFNPEPPLFGPRVDRRDPTLQKDDFPVSWSRLQRNFCQERIEDTKKLGRYLFPISQKSAPSTKSSVPHQAKKEQDKISPFALIAAGVAIVAIIVLIVKALMK